MPTIVVKNIVTADDLHTAFFIRKTVFVTEQKCCPNLEFENEEVSHHFLAFADGQPAGTCRWRKTEKGYKCERFAVLKQYRSCGVGTMLLKTLLQNLPAHAHYIYLHAQLTAMGLYAKYGFVAEGQMFEEAGIQHYKMVIKKPV
jgi:predicted GNAT family N-acyltransferase